MSKMMMKAKQRFGNSFLQAVAAVLSATALWCAAPVAFADGGPVITPPPSTGAYAATFVEDRDHVSIISFAGDYNKTLPGGQTNSEARAVVAKEFYKHHPDNYDFLVVFSTFEYDTGSALAFHLGLKNDVQGIGLPLFNNTAGFGSSGKLQGYIDMAAMSRYSLDPLDPQFETVLSTLSHEVLHQWASHIKFKNPDGSLNDALLGKDGSHWSYLLNSDASVEYGAKWRDNGDGTFTSIATRKFYSPLDLYLMGIYKAEEVPPFFVIENPAIDKTKLPEENVTISGTRREVTIEQVIGAEGQRFPSADTAQKSFRMGFVLLTGAGEQISDTTITRLNHARNAFMTRFAILTAGRGIARVYPEALPADVVTPPGIVEGGDIRSSAASIDDAIAWLEGQQDTAGYWNDKDSTRLRDTAVTLNALQTVDQGFNGGFDAINWLSEQDSGNNDFIARQLILLGASATAGIQALKDKLLAAQNTDGGWGLAQGFDSDALDTALAIQGLLKTGAEQAVIDKAVQYLLQSQNADGGWSNADGKQSRVSVTTTVLTALKAAGQGQGAVNAAFAWLKSKQDTDGGFGDTGTASTVYDTANVLDVYMLFDRVDEIQSEAAASYILAQQSVEGSFNGSTYTTALAVAALKRFNFTNWAMDPVITVNPAAATDGTRVMLSIQLRNDSNIFTPQGVLRIYDGDPASTGIAIGDDIVVPLIAPNAAVNVSTYWDSFGKGGSHTFHALVDPDAVYSEMSEKDNQASVQVTVAPAPAGIELSVVPIDLAASPPHPNRLPTTMGISANVRNFGLTDANNVRVVLWKGGIGTGSIVDEVTLSIPNRSSVVTNFTNVLDAAGTTLYTVQIDPDNSIIESRKDNNSADIEVRTDPSVDFAVAATDITTDKSPAIFGDDLSFTVKLHNYGTSDSPSNQVNYIVTNGVDTRQLGSNNLQLAAGASTEQTITWRVDLTGDLTFTARIDPDNLATEIDETNNQASFSITSQTANGPNLLVSHTDLSFNPAPGNEGYPVDLSISVRNNGNTAANNVDVAFYDGEPSLGGVLLGTQTIATLAANAAVQITQNWAAIPTASDKLIFVVVDPNNTIAEFSEADNIAFEILSVLSLPDFAVSAADISIQPPFPTIGASIRIDATIANLGRQSASNVVVRAYDGDPAGGGKLIEEQTLAQLAGNNATTLSFAHTLSGIAAAHTIVIQIDPDGAILERFRDNNTARKDVAVQDGNAFVTEKFISPNGDGVKDRTQFFFRTQTATDVTVQVLNRNKKLIRRYRNADLDNLTQGSVVWDGLDDLGRLVEDGVYTLQVLDPTGQLLAEVSVVSDTNRSSLLKAIGTKYELYTNMTCELPVVDDLSIARDELNATFRIYDGLSPDAAYPKGIYRMGANGADLRVVVPESWFNSIPAELQANNLQLNYARPSRLIKATHASNILFQRTDRYVSTNGSLISYFHVDADGKNIRYLDTLSQDARDNSSGLPILSADGKYVYLFTSNSIFKYNAATWVRETIIIDQFSSIDVSSYNKSLSPDGRYISFYGYNYVVNNAYVSLLLFDTQTDSFQFITSNDIQTNANPVWAPDSKKFSYLSYYYRSTPGVRVFDTNGVLTHTFTSPDTYSLEEYGRNISWNSSSTEFTLSIAGYTGFGTGAVATTAEDNGGIYVASLIDNNLRKVADFQPCDWCDSSYSYHISTWDGSDWVKRGELHYSRFLREQNLDLSTHLPDADGEYKVRIRQVGKEAAHVESVSLFAGNNRFTPGKAVKLERTLLNRLYALFSNKPQGIDVLEQVRFPDNEVLDLHEQEMEVQWTDVPADRRIVLALNAREEELSKLKTLPFSYPAQDGGSYKYQLTATEGLIFDGAFNDNDKLGTPLFKQFTRPDTGHPPGTVYGYAKSDAQYLYAALDFTVDNTMDGDLDWASLRVKTASGWKEYKVNVRDNTYGKVTFAKTPNVPYTHKYYEFRIPLQELGVQSGDVVDIAFQAYGTAAIVVDANAGNLLPRYGEVHWDPASQALLYDAGWEGRWSIFLDEANRLQPAFADWPADMDGLQFIPSGRKLLYRSNRDANNPNSVCYQKGWTDDFSFESLQNLVVDLRASRSEQQGGILLRGTAADLHFARYQLDYADVNAANDWNPVAPSASTEVIDDRFTTWVPPGKGQYFVRLTAYDKAGNSRRIIKRVSWGNVTSISDLYRSPEFVSPNGDGVQDSMALHYRVLEPVHLEFNIYNESDDLVRTMTRDHSLIGTEHDLIWDGRDNTGLTVADGTYRITVQNFEFFVIVDNTAPLVSLTLNDAAQIDTIPPPFGHNHIIEPSIDWTVADENQAVISVESGEGANPASWNQIGTIEPGAEGNYKLSITQFTNNRFRFVVTDKAGNTSITSTLLGKEEIVFTGRVAPAGVKNFEPITGKFGETVRNPIGQLFIQYKDTSATAWLEEDISGTDIVNGIFNASVLPADADNNKSYDVRIKLLDTTGTAYFSNIRTFIYPKEKEFEHVYLGSPYTYSYASKDFNGLDLSAKYAYGIKGSLPKGVRVKIRALRTFIKSSKDPRYAVGVPVYITGGVDAPSPVKFNDHIVKNLAGCTPYELISEADVERIDLTDPAKPLVKRIESISSTPYGTPCLGVKPVVKYAATPICGGTPDKSVTINLTPFTQNEFGLTLLTLSYIDPATGIEDVLFNVNKPVSNKVYTYKVDTSALPEGVGSFHLKLINDANQEWRGDVSYIVDHTPPAVGITYPVDGQQLCGTPRANNQGGFDNVLPLEVLIDDPVTPGIGAANGVEDYLTSTLSIATGNPVDGELFYQALDTVSSDDTKRHALLRENDENRQAGTYYELVNYDGEYTLKLTGRDIAGFKQCTTRTFSVDGRLDATQPGIDTGLISPNADGNFDEVTIDYSVQESVLVTADVYPGTKNEKGEFIPDAAPLRSLAANQQILSGGHNLVWDGLDETGSVVPDGNYAVVMSYKDTCGNLAKFQTSTITVDTLKPVVAIDSPIAGQPLAMLVEIFASVDDLHLKDYTVSYGAGSAPQQWVQLGNGTRPISREPAASWNTVGLVGDYTLRLAANDHAGNTAEVTLPLALVARTELMNNLEALPQLFSPNNDNRRETSTVRIGVLSDVSLTVVIKDETGAIVRTLAQDQARTAGTHNLVWDGRSDAGVMPADADYKAEVTAVSAVNPAVSQQEAISIILDRTPPAVTISRPQAGFAAGSGSVIGTIEDAHISSYSISITDTPATPLWKEISAGNTNQYTATLGALDGLAEGEFALKVVATDAGEITTEQIIPFEIDSTAPLVDILSPKNDEFIGLGKAPVDITARVDDKNIKLYSLSIGTGDAPQAWTELVSGGANVVNNAIHTLDVAAYADGVYTLRLTASDKANNSAEATVTVNIDNTPPDAAITSPLNGAYVKGPADILGSALDLNFADYTLSIAPGNMQTADQWSNLTTSTTAVDTGRLLDWQLLPVDGAYVLRLRVTDKANNTSEVKLPVNVDQTPPAAPAGLTAAVTDLTNASLQWNANTEADLAGYAVYRDGVRITTALLPSAAYLDANVAEGRHEYTVTAFDHAGWESGPSALAEVTIDTTPPVTAIHLPADGGFVSGLVEVRGTAHSSDDFKQYRLYVGEGATPTTWQLLRQSPVPTLADVLAEWNTVVLTEGASYTLKLEAEDLSGNTGTAQVTVVVDNLPPEAPTGLVAVPNGTDVSLSWNANTEADLLGYLIFRNERIANSTGTVVGDLRPYAVVNTTYPDLSLADGPYTYTIVAIDQAGNASDPSLPSDVLIDTRPPHAVISTPVDGSAFEAPLYIKAVSEDSDIAQVQFQYRAAGAADWIDLDVADLTDPYEIILDPSVPGLTYGNYQLQAVATDVGLKVDPAPTPITVTYKDLTRPAMVLGVSSQVNGGDVTINWTANTDTDLAGYHLERASGGAEFVRISTTLLTATTYVDPGLADATYRYRVVAVDASANEADPSAENTAVVYTPVLIPAYTPVNGTGPISISGTGIGLAVAGGTITNSLGTLDLVSVATDLQGNFTLKDLLLQEGDNTYRIQLIDAAGNRSKIAEMNIQSGTAPSRPTGLVASNTGFDVSLLWNANPETNIAGYRVFRDGAALIADIPVTGLTATASYNSSYAQYVVNGTTNTSWPYWYMNVYPPQTVSGAWIAVSMPAEKLVTKVDVYWYNASYRALDFDIQAWTGSNWLTISEVRNTAATNVSSVDLPVAYPTDQLRMVIRKPAYKRSSDGREYVIVTEIKAYSLGQQATPDFAETVQDGNHSYTVTAVNTLGFESIPSDPTVLPVGDVTAPAEVVLSVTTSGSDADLSWSASSATDVAHYDIYRDGSLIATHTDLVSLTYTDAGLVNGTYTYMVKAVDNVGNASQPSNEVQVGINIALPDAPLSVSVTAVDEGKALLLNWQPAAGGTPAGYRILRSLTPGGPYEFVADVSDTTYLDEGLVNGTRYYYVVVALDDLGNTSVNSTETNGVPQDIVAPPVSLFYPTTPGKLYITSDKTTDIAGFSEAAAAVSVYQGDSLISELTAASGNQIQQQSLQEGVNRYWMSPDGQRAAGYAYINSTNSYELHLLDLDTTVTTVLTSISEQYNDIVQWLPDSHAFVYQVYNPANGRVSLRYHDVQANTDSLLGASENDNLYVFSLSPDGKKLVAYGRRAGVNALWLFDLQTSQWTNLGQVNNQPYQYTWSWSPDSNKVAFMLYSAGYRLYVADTVTAAITDTGITVSSPYQTSWSPDGDRIAYANNGIYLYNVAAATSQQITQISAGFDPQWTNDPQRLLYIANSRIFEYNVATQENKEIYFAENGIDTRAFQVTKSGYLGIHSWPYFERITPAGYFSVKNIELIPGDNIFAASATDAAGNTSNMSDAIVVNLDIANRPDFAVDVSSIRLLPNAPLENTQARIAVTVRNQGAVASPASSLSLVVIDSEGNNISLLDGYNLAAIQAGGSQTLTADWNIGLAGLYSLVGVVDAADDVAEVSEANNFALKEVRVHTTVLPELTITTDKSAYDAHENVQIDVSVYNGGADFDGRVELVIEDSAGYQVSTIASDTINGMVYADVHQLTEFWNTGTVFAGSYRARAGLFDAAGSRIADISTAFDINAVANITASVSTDNDSYPANTNVIVSATIDYSTGNSIVGDAVADLRILDAGSNEITASVQQLGEMLPADKSTISLDWNTGLSAVGDYTVILEVSRDLQLVSSASKPFRVIAGPPDVSGTLTLSADAPALGDVQTVSYTLTNNGNAALARLPTRVLLVDPALQVNINSHMANHDMAVGGSASATADFATAGLALKNYNVVLQADVDQTGLSPQWLSLQSLSFPLVDRTPPVVAMRKPLHNGFIRGDAKASVYALDLHSAVSDVRISLDNAAWTKAVLDDPANALYAHILPGLSEGPHQIKAQATDSWGNFATSANVTFVVDNTAPVISISGVSNSAAYNSVVTPLITVNETNPADTFITLNGLPYVSGTPLDAEGRYKLVVRAVDLAGNSSQSEVDFIIDTTPPVVTVSGVLDGVFYNSGVVPLISISDNNDYSQSITLNSAPFVSGTSVTLENAYQLNVVAEDIAGNKTIVTVNFELDLTPPLINVSGVANDAIYNVDVTPVISVTDKNLNSHTSTLNTQAYVSGTTVTAEGIYRLDVNADDKAGNQSASVTRFEIDKTPPQIIVTGVEDGGIYNYELAPEINVIDTNLKNYTVTLDGQAYTSGSGISTEGLHELIVIAEDIPGNQSTHTLNFEIDTTPPVVTITAPPAGARLNTLSTDVTGSSEPLSTVYLTIGAYTASAVADINGRFNFLQVPLLEGKNTIAAYAQDRAKNIGPTVSVEVLVILAELHTDIRPASGLLVWAPIPDRACRKPHAYEAEDDDRHYDDKDDDHSGSDDHEQDAHSDGHDESDDDDSSQTVCHSHFANEYIGHEADRAISFVGDTLDNHFSDYLIVHSESQFIEALRSQRYGTLLLLELNKSAEAKHDDDDEYGSAHRNHDRDDEEHGDDKSGHTLLKISEHARNEIRSMIASGTGLVWLKTHPDNNEHWQDILGAKHNGVISKLTGIELEESPASSAAYQAASGKAARVRITTGTATGKLLPSASPAMVLNTYGKAAVALVNFDPSLITDVSAAQVILAEVLTYAASKNTHLIPGGMTDINWYAIKVVPGMKIRFDERLAEGMLFVNAYEGMLSDTKTEASWLRLFEPDAEYFNALVQLPQIKGVYTVNGELSGIEPDETYQLVEGKLEVEILKDRADFALILLEGLSTLSLPADDHDELEEVLEYIRKVTGNSQTTLEDVEKSIYLLVEAEDELSETDVDVSQLEAQLGDLLRTYQVQWTRLKK